MQHRYDDASMENGFQFILGAKRTGVFFDDPPTLAIAGAVVTDANIKARKEWSKRRGAIAKQVGWGAHGQVRILKFEDGVEMAVWRNETQYAN